MTTTLDLPRTWRPFGARVMLTVLGGLLLVLVIGVWFAWGSDVRARFTIGQRGTLVLFGVLGFAVWFALMRSRVTADTDGVTVVNGYRRRVFEWSQVVAVNLRRGAPWAGLDLSDGTSISMIAIQGSDGQRAVRAVQELRRLVEAHTPSGPDD
jgi:hypothetical protein